MRQIWRYMDSDFEVDTDDPKSYSRILHEMMDYNDCYDELDTFMTEEVGSGADVLLMMIWDGAQYTAMRLHDKFIMWMVLDHMELVRELLEKNATMMESTGAEE